MSDTNLKKTTQQATDAALGYDVPMLTGLTVVYHPDISRVGEVVPVVEFASGKSCSLSRSEPCFRRPFGEETGPLTATFVSRKKVTFEAPTLGGIRIGCEEGVRVRLDGTDLVGQAEYTHADLERGVVMVLGNAVVLLFHLIQPAVFTNELEPQPGLGLIGKSASMHQVRARIMKVAATSTPVLLRGETGVGKELVARAIHENGRRRDNVCISVNMSGIQQSLAASELFGHKKNAFTGATSDKPGFFGMADGGTLFLDEIGDTSLEIQSLILRAVELGEIQVVGAGAPRKVDVRLVAATDSDLERAIEDGRFKRPLLERIQESVVRIPPLRERKEDIGLLFLHFLQHKLASQGEAGKLATPPIGKSPWLPASLVEKLLGYDWPGNVRQLRNIASQVAETNQGEAKFKMDDEVWRLLGGDSAPPKAVSRTPMPAIKRRPISEIPDSEIFAALRRHAFNISNAAGALGVSSPRLHARIDESPEIPKASKLTEDQIRGCMREFGDDIDRMARHLEVSPKGLKLRMKQLGLR